MDAKPETKKKRRKRHGTGYIEKLPQGTWRAVVSRGLNAAGKRIRESKTFPERVDAAEWMHRQLLQAKGGWSARPLGDWMDTWLNDKRNTLANESIKWYERHMNRLKESGLLKVKLRSLEPILIRDALDSIAKKHSDNVRGGCHTTLRAALQSAVELQQIPSNPAMAVRGRSRTRAEEMAVWNEDEVARFLKVADASPWKLWFRLALDTGARSGEINALQWSDFDYQSGTVNIARTLEELGGKLAVKVPKTKTSRRKVILSAQTLALVKASRPDPYIPRDRLFGDSKGGFIRRSNFRVNVFLPLIKAAGVPVIRIHDLRHTNATLLLAAGVSLKVVQERLGHASPEITMKHYMHAMPKMQEKAAEAIGAILNVPYLPHTVKNTTPESVVNSDS